MNVPTGARKPGLNAAIPVSMRVVATAMMRTEERILAREADTRATVVALSRAASARRDSAPATSPL